MFRRATNVSIRSALIIGTPKSNLNLVPTRLPKDKKSVAMRQMTDQVELFASACIANRADSPIWCQVIITRSTRVDLAGQLAGVQMPSSLVSPPRPEDDSQAQQKRATDRLCIAVELVQRLRQAGFDCQLGDGSQTRQ